MQKFVGYKWLSDRAGFVHYGHFHTSAIGGRLKTDIDKNGNVTNYFTSVYSPDDNIFSHIEFALKYEGINFSILKYTFNSIARSDLTQYIENTPSGKYTRQMGFLYEMLIGRLYDSAPPVTGNYVDVADGGLYVLPNGVANTRWRVNNNLTGNSNFCPLVRKTDVIKSFLNKDFSLLMNNAFENVSPEIYSRAVNYFYFKETKSSNDIERDDANPARQELFVHLLRSAGSVDIAERLSMSGLVKCQNAIADKRFHNNAFRENQNYVGGSPYYGGREIVHLIGMPPQHLKSVMQGLVDFSATSHGMNTVIRAACLSFGFVFIHPFEDGNGRIHRFLINDVLANDGLLSKGIVLPISAIILSQPHEYDAVLEEFSKKLMLNAEYDINDAGEIHVENADVIQDFYRFPDMTKQAEYLFDVVEKTITNEMVREFGIIQSFDHFRSGARNIVDMPDRLLEQMMGFIHQNNGKLSKAKRTRFSMITDEEIALIEKVYENSFQRNAVPNDGEQLSSINSASNSGM